MSYRAFKRLLGETSLERKCRFLLGAGILLLITLSFWVYAQQTETIAYDQTENTGRLLVTPILSRFHVSEESKKAMESFQDLAEQTWPEGLREYKYRILKPKAKKPEYKPEGEELTIVNSFQQNSELTHESRFLRNQGVFYYFAAIRGNQSCIDCHNRIEHRESEELLKPDDLMAVVSIRLSTKPIETSVHVNRAILISTAILTAILIMAGSYLIIRYVIVKPVKHLKDVSDAISAGQLNVRSEIQTGDEFEDLSHAFNRMLRNLVSMQERYQKLNGDLDRKVDELAHANMALYESNRLKSDFLATISHELRTPLNSILGFSNVLLDSKQNLSEKQARWLLNIKTSGQQLLALINDILDLAKIEAGKMEVHPEEFSIKDLCDGLAGMFRPLAEKKNIDIRLQYASQVPMLKQDQVKLRQIVSNLLSNAVKFTPEGGSVTLHAKTEGSQLVLTVTDTGVGISEEDQERIFEKFRQAGNPMTREHDGTGLGLSIVRELSKLLGGDVSLHSELGRGSSFTIRIPMHLMEDPRNSMLPLTPLVLPNGRLFESHRLIPEPSPNNDSPKELKDTEGSANGEFI